MQFEGWCPQVLICYIGYVWTALGSPVEEWEAKVWIHLLAVWRLMTTGGRRA